MPAMGLLDFFRKPDPNRFARLATECLKAAGVTSPISYDPEEFSLSYGDEDARFFLSNAYAEYCKAPRSQRNQILNQYVQTMATLPQIPERFEEVRAKLLPRVRTRLAYERLERKFFRESPETRVPFKPLADHLGIEVVVDMPTSASSVNLQQLQDWGVTFEEILSIARDNLWEISKSDLTQLGPGLFSSCREDTYDAARLLLHDLIWQLPVKGSHIAVVPHRNLLLVCGSEDVEAQGALSQLALKALTDNRSESGIPLILKGSTWETLRPTANETGELRRLYVLASADEYEEQKAFLEETGDVEAFIASLFVIEQQADKRLLSVTSWGEGIRTLLPLADCVGLTSADRSVNLLGVAWEDLQRVAGHRMKPQSMYPPRWLVEDFPSTEELAQLKSQL